MDSRLERYCRGVLSSVYDLTRLEVLPVHCLGILINTKIDWLDCEQYDKPNCTLSWLSGMINPIGSWLGCVFLCVLAL